MEKIDPNDLACFSPSSEALIKILAPGTTDDMLLRISFLDYGKDQKAHFLALKKLRDESLQKKGLQWEPAEVLELGMSGPPYSNYGNFPVCDERTDHIIHAFILACVLRALPFQGGFALSGSLLEASSRLVKQAEKIPDLQPSDVASHFSWLLLSLAHDEDDVFLAVWLVYAVLDGQISAPKETVESLVNLAHRCEVDPEITQYRADSYFKRDYLHPVWQDIGNRLLKANLNDLPKDFREKITDIGSFLANP